MKDRLVKTILKLVLALILALLIGETVIRIFLPQQESMKWFETSEKYGYSVKRNFEQNYEYIGSDFIMHVKTNSLGIRDEELNAAQISDRSVKKVLLLGDSFIFGHGVNMEDHFKTKLQELQPDNTLVINAGIGGWGTLQEVNYCKDNFKVFNPDVVVLTFCINDPEDDVRFLNGLANNGKGLFYFPGKLIIKQNSHLYRILYKRFHNMVHDFFLKLRSGESTVEVDMSSEASITNEEWKRTKGYLLEFFEDLRDYKSESILILQPTAPWDESVRKLLKELADENNGVFFNDLYKETKDMEENRRVLPFNGHWSKELHIMYAESLDRLILSTDSIQN